jgi:hypothetical protein
MAGGLTFRFVGYRKGGMTHRKTVRHYHEVGHPPELTFSCYRQLPLLTNLEYIHNNPVNRGLCRWAVGWKWSSARYYHAVPARQQYPNLPTIYGLPEGAIS